MQSNSISFEDTTVAFAAKNDKALRRAHFLFAVVNDPTLSKIATGLVRTGFWLKLPIEGIVKKTIYSQFCGGETIEDCQKTIQLLSKFNIRTILDYSVEGANDEHFFNETKEEILRAIEKASDNSYVPFTVFKPTGVASADLLEKVSLNENLTLSEMDAWAKAKDRFDEICKAAHKKGVRVLIDAEDSWLQNAIDDLAYELMERYNKEDTIVFNTFQMYRKDMLKNLQLAFHKAAMNQHYLGAKLVRGAYMEKERARAEEMNYPDPIQDSKEDTDRDFNKALHYCVDNKQRVSVVCGSHNEYSNKYLTVLMQKHSMNNNDPRVWFAQLYGMGDNISFNLANAGYNVIKYVPYGPVKAVMPYLFRRAEENTSVAGQSSRELTMIRKELDRRSASKK